MGFLDTVKGWLNIGGVRVKIEGVNPQISTGRNQISGQAILTSKSDRHVLSVNCQVVNEHTSKPGGESETSTLVLGEQVIGAGFDIKAGETREIPFTVTYFLQEKMRHAGGALGMAGKLGAMVKGEKDSYSLAVACDVKGTVNDPSARIPLKFVQAIKSEEHTTKRLERLLPAPLGWLFAGKRAQFQAGDTIVVIKDQAYINDTKQVIQIADRGCAFTVTGMEGKWVRISIPSDGRIHRTMVASPENAIAEFSEQIRQDKSDLGAYNARAMVWKNKGDLDKAIADFTEVIRLNPQHAGAILDRADCWSDKGDFDKCIADCTEAIRIEPESALAYGNRSAALISKSEFDQAISDATEAIDLDPGLAFAYFNRGVAYYGKKEYAKALAAYKEIIDDVDDSDVAALSAVAWVYATCPAQEIRDAKQALEFATNACELDGWKSANCLGTLAAAHAESGDFEKAAEFAAKALAAATEKEKPELEVNFALYKAGKPARDEGKK
jgi:tetratricopeptide (TPR) repeat protein